MTLLWHLLLCLYIFNFHQLRCETITCPEGGCTCDPMVSGEACTLNCAAGICRRDAVTCRDWDSCTINCDGGGACRNAQVTCPYGNACSITCTGHSKACSGLSVTLNQATAYQCTETAPAVCPPTPLPYTASPTLDPTLTPTTMPSISPSSQTISPTLSPSTNPSQYPTYNPTTTPTDIPSLSPTDSPTISSSEPTVSTSFPSLQPSLYPSATPSTLPTNAPSKQPSTTQQPTVPPSNIPSVHPVVSVTTTAPSANPTQPPTSSPIFNPTNAPSNVPSITSVPPSNIPSVPPSDIPSTSPSGMPSVSPSNMPSTPPSDIPSVSPNNIPSVPPSNIPSTLPSNTPTVSPSNMPSVPSILSTTNHTLSPSRMTSSTPTTTPTVSSPSSSLSPSTMPTIVPSQAPVITTSSPSQTSNTLQPSLSPTNMPSASPTDDIRSPAPTMFPLQPTSTSTDIPSTSPTTPSMTSHPSVAPFTIQMPSRMPSNHPTINISPNVSVSHTPTTPPSDVPDATTVQPSASPINMFPSSPTPLPSEKPTSANSAMPSTHPTAQSSSDPTLPFTVDPSNTPTVSPTGIKNTQIKNDIASTTDPPENNNYDTSDRTGSAFTPLAEAFNELWIVLVIIGSFIMLIICTGFIIAWYVRRTVRQKVELAHRVSVALNEFKPHKCYKRDRERLRSASSITIAKLSDKQRMQSVASMSLPNSPSALSVDTENNFASPISRSYQPDNARHIALKSADTVRINALFNIDAESSDGSSNMDSSHEEDIREAMKGDTGAYDTEIAEQKSPTLMSAVSEPQQEPSPLYPFNLEDTQSIDCEVVDDMKEDRDGDINTTLTTDNVFLAALQGFNASVRRDSEFEHKPHKSAGIDSIQHNTVRRLSNKFKEAEEDETVKGKAKQMTQINELEVDDNEEELEEAIPQLTSQWTNEDNNVSDRRSITISEMRHSQTIGSYMRDVVGLREQSMIVSLSEEHEDTAMAMSASPHLGDKIIRHGTMSFHRRLTNDVVSGSNIMDGILSDMTQDPEI